MQFDIPTLDLQVSPLGGSEDFLFGAGTEFAGCTGERHFLVGGGGSFAALALQADLPAGGVQVDAGFLSGFLFVVGFADREDRNAILDDEAVIALGDNVGVLPGGDREVLAGSQDMVLGSDQGDAGWGGDLEAGFGPGGNGADTTQGSLDALSMPLPAWAALAGGGAHDFFGVLQAVDGWELVSLGITPQGGILFGGNFSQALAEAFGILRMGDRFAAVEVGAAGIGPGIGAQEQAVAGT